MKDKKSLFLIILISLVIIILLIASVFGYLYKNNKSNIDCTYNLESSSYNEELASICKKNNIKYMAYVNKEELGNLELNNYNVAKYFNFKYFDNINNTDASTRKNIILSYLNFDKNTCYSKKIIEDINSDLFIQNVDLKDIIDINDIFDNTEISDNFICVKSVNTNDVIISSPYYLLNNKNIVEISKNNGILYVHNIKEYSDNNTSNAKVININDTNINSLLKKEEFSNDHNDYNIILSGNTEYTFKHPNTKIEIKNDEVYLIQEDETLLAKSIDKVFLQEYEEYEGYNIYLLDKDGNIYKKSDDSYLKYNKINTDYKFKNIYYIFEDTIVGETIDNKLFDLYDEKIIDNYENDVYIGNDYKNVKYKLKVNLNDYSILMDDKDTNYKVKYSFGNYLLTTDDYLFSVQDGKLFSNNKVNEILVEDINLEDNNETHRLYITFDNNEKIALFDVY